MVLEVNDNNLEEVLSKGNITVLDFYANWCGPCRMYSPIISKFAEDNPDIGVAKINVDANSELATTYGVRGIPMTVLLQNGRLITKVPGVVPQVKLEEFTNNLK
jgi:thioredoxin 1